MEREVLSLIEAQHEAVAASWNHNGNNTNNNVSTMNPSDPNVALHFDSHLPSFNSMLEGDWYMNNLSNQNDVFDLDPSSCFLPSPESCFSPFPNDTTTTITSKNFPSDFDSLTPFQDANSHVLMGFSDPMTTLNNSEPTQLDIQQHLFGPSNTALVPSRPDVLSPLQSLPLVGAPPSLFQKQGACSNGADDGLALLQSSEEGKFERGLNYHSDDEEDVIEIFNTYNTNNNDNYLIDVEDRKGKKKGMPAKNLLTERRRRKKLNDRMFMLRSIVPKISKV